MSWSYGIYIIDRFSGDMTPKKVLEKLSWRGETQPVRHSLSVTLVSQTPSFI